MTTWETFAPTRRVLAVVHNVTAATRLFDVVQLISEDPRVELVFTDPGSSAFPAGTDDFLRARGVRRLSWPEAIEQDFDLAISASHGSTLHELTSPILIVPHGMGYNKLLENRKSKIENRKSVFGLSPEWLLHDGQVVAKVLALSHEEQLHRLARDCPPAASRARVVGDLAFDQLTASRIRRTAYRRALGVSDTETLVVLSSTWGPDSLLGQVADLPAALGTQLPVDEFRIAMAVHPNVWWGHSPWQVRQWLAGCVRAGVDVLEDPDDWRASLVAADVVVGDHGSVTFYAAALGTPVVLATAPEHAVAPDSPIGMFLRRAPLMIWPGELADQLRNVIANHDPGKLADITSFTTSVPGGSAAALRMLLYELLDLPEPAAEAGTPLLHTPARELRKCHSHLVQVTPRGPAAARLTRFPAERLRTDPGTQVLVVGPDEPSRRWHELADVLVGAAGYGSPQWVRDTLGHAPGALLATAPATDGKWLLGDRQGALLHVSTAGDLFSAVALRELAAGRGLATLTGTWRLTVGGRILEVTVEVAVGR